MPGGDGTGPQGMGPMSGRALGYCAGNNVPGCMTPGPGRGQGRGFGRGWGRGRGFGRGGGGGGGWGGGNFAGAGAYTPYAYPMTRPYAAPWAAPAPDPKAEQRFLEEQQATLQSHLDEIRQRLDELAAAAKAAKKE